MDQVEGVPIGCGLPPDGNRYFTVPDTAMTLPTVCFSSCDPCIIELVPVTFLVDMTGQTVSNEGIHIAGNFQDWDPSATLMTPQNNNVYAFITELVKDEQVEYKFINGSTWAEVESVPLDCALPPMVTGIL